LALSKKLHYERGLAGNFAMLGDVYLKLDSLERTKYYLIRAANSYEKLKPQPVYAKILLVLGNIYFVTDNYPEALNAYQKSMKICEENGYEETLPHLYNNIGSIYLEMNNLNKAKINIEAAYAGFKKNNAESNSAKSLTSLAIVSKRLNNFDQSLEYMDRALKIFTKLDDIENIAEANRIMGLIYRDKKEYVKASRYFIKAYRIITQEDFHSETPKSIVLSTIYMNLAQNSSFLNKKADAIRYAKKSLEIAEPNKFLKTMSEDYLILNRIYEQSNQIDSAYKYLKLNKLYSDSLMTENVIEQITQLQLEYEFARKISKRELEQSIKDAEQQQKEYIYIFTIILVIFVAIVGFLLFINQRNKTKQSKLKRKNLELEQKTLTHKFELNKKELEFKNKELATNIMYTAKKVGMITNIAKELQKAKADFKVENRDVIDNVIRQLENTSGDDTWREFEVRFQDVHTEFYDNLNKVLPDITPNEKKLCAFLKLNMTTKDISAITHQTVKSITMARYRLRQKLNLERDENLIAFLSKL